jgi:hypothetical protein
LIQGASLCFARFSQIFVSSTQVAAGMNRRAGDRETGPAAPTQVSRETRALPRYPIGDGLGPVKSTRLPDGRRSFFRCAGGVNEGRSLIRLRHLRPGDHPAHRPVGRRRSTSRTDSCAAPRTSSTSRLTGRCECGRKESRVLPLYKEVPSFRRWQAKERFSCHHTPVSRNTLRVTLRPARYPVYYFHAPGFPGPRRSR